MCKANQARTVPLPLVCTALKLLFTCSWVVFLCSSWPLLLYKLIGRSLASWKVEAQACTTPLLSKPQAVC